ncbi:L,D-transpeptidase family protein [Hyphomicrobium sp.]|uniref:L,D-transpeptidase n=1 Tax=Hyphomicrobium sp. TaxID=82 RepID=UPI000FAC64E4|nr:L,D-transpeptidase family protein [Hyphomicrobium sp.]RUP09466.1 MAG: L,D-transpeptidase [Hyphomicrobium sp.]
MSLPRFMSGLTIATIVMAGGLMSAASAKAEDLVDFLWGGSPEYGGGRSIVTFDPQYKPGQIIVSFSDRRLYWITKTGEAMTYPVAIPTGEARWQGVTSVTNKRVNPPWTPTPEMVSKNPRLPRWVPGGHPMNPLGIRAMYLGTSAYRIHGTDAPWTIGQAVSHGCIRMTNEDVLDLYPRVPVGTRVTVTWQQFSTKTVSSGDKYPRYGDADSNPRAASATPASASSASRSSSSASASSGSSNYEYGAYARKTSSASSQSNDNSFFFWDETPKKTASVSQSATDSQDQESRDATKDDNDQALAPKPFEKKQASEQSLQQKDAEKAPKRKSTEAKSEAKSEMEQSASDETVSKKKAAETPSVKKKATVASASTHEPLDPIMSPAMSVPDPVKPSEVSGSPKESDTDALPVHKAVVQVQ